MPLVCRAPRFVGRTRGLPRKSPCRPPRRAELRSRAFRARRAAAIPVEVRRLGLVPRRALRRPKGTGSRVRAAGRKPFFGTSSFGSLLSFPFGRLFCRFQIPFGPGCLNCIKAKLTTPAGPRAALCPTAGPRELAFLCPPAV